MTIPLDKFVSALRGLEPDLEAVLLAGSHARGDADAFSDVDLVALTREAPQREERVWLERAPDGRILHVSVAGEQLATPEAAEPASWAFGFPAVDVQTYLWATNEARNVLGADPSLRFPPGTPELEDFVELYRKFCRSHAAGDPIGLRWTARMLADYAPGLLREFNPECVVASPVEAMRCALRLPNVPAHYAQDLEVCWALRPSADADVIDAGRRLTTELLAFLRDRYAEGGRPLDEAQALLVEGAWSAYLETPADSDTGVSGVLGK